MKHAFIDTYADLNTPLHKFSAEIKLIFFILFLLIIIFTPIRYAMLFLVYGLIALILIYLSKIPVNFIFKRIIEILPFIIIVSISAISKKQGLGLFFNCLIKAILAVLLVLVVSCTTRFSKLLAALYVLKVPRLFVHLLSFMYRYSFLLEDQLLKIKRAYEARNINDKYGFNKVKILSNILGTLFIRTYERAERIYLAMCARGYNGENDN